MLKPTPKHFIRNPFANGEQIMMSELIEMVLESGYLPIKKRRDVTSSIRRFCILLGTEPCYAPANHWWYRERIKSFTAIQAGVAAKTWSNIKSNVSFALGHVGIVEKQPRYLCPLSPQWQEIKDQLHSDSLCHGLSRLMHFCSAQSIAPDQVDDEVMALFHEALRVESFVVEPEKLHKSTCRKWNQARTLIEQPLQFVTEPSLHQTYCLNWKEIHPDLVADVDAFLQRMSGSDVLAIDGPPKQLKPSSIKARKFSIRQMISGLHHQGHDMSKLTSLSQLLKIETAKKALGYHIDRAGGKSTSQIGGLAQVLVLIGRYHCKIPEAHLRDLVTLRNRLHVRHKGLAPTNREKLSQFRDEKNIISLLMFPQDVYERLRRKNRLLAKDTLLLEIALAVEFELMLPLRRMNLVKLVWGQHIRPVTHRGQKRFFVNIESHETKNGQAISAHLPEFATTLLEFWMERGRPNQMDGPTDYIFPGRLPDTHKSLDQFSRRFSKTLLKELGLHVHLHLMRHIGAFLYLGEKPGAYEVVRRVLGHAKLSGTINSYVGLEMDPAVDAFDTVILGIRDNIRSNTDGASLDD